MNATIEQPIPTAKPKFLADPVSPIEMAFETGGKTFWNFVDPFATPALRGLAALDVYEEMRQRTTRETREKELDATDVIYKEMEQALISKDGKLNMVTVVTKLSEARKINQYARERLSMLATPEVMYNLASVVYFTEDENPNLYDMKYNREVKIPMWKKSAGVYDFFLLQPLHRLMPFLKEYEQNLQTSLTVVEKMTQLHLQHLSTILSRRKSIKGPVLK
jgi:hypothetical protein